MKGEKHMQNIRNTVCLGMVTMLICLYITIPFTYAYTVPMIFPKQVDELSMDYLGIMNKQQIAIEKIPATIVQAEIPIEVTNRQITIPELPIEKAYILQMATEVSSRYSTIDEYLILAIIKYESTFNPEARNGNCVGLMQVSTHWHKDRAELLGVSNFEDPLGNLLVGSDYLNDLIIKYDNLHLALMVYNMGDATAKQLYNAGYTTDYARNIINYANDLRTINGG